MARIAPYARKFLDFILHLLAATLGTAIAEHPFLAFYHPATFKGLMVQGYSVSALVSFTLGGFFYYHRRSQMAKWIGFCGLIGVMSHFLWGPWSLLLQIDAAAEHAIWVINNIVTIRALGYAAGALCAEAYFKSSKPASTEPSLISEPSLCVTTAEQETSDQ